MTDMRRPTDPMAWRTNLLGLCPTTLYTADEILDACSRFTGIDWRPLPHGDPILAKSQALLDRDTSTIWIDSSITQPQKRVILAHEFAHVALHTLASDFDPSDDSNDLPEPFSMVEGYSGAQYSERSADRWAAQLLLPSAVLTTALSNLAYSASDISRITGLPERFVVRRCVDVLLDGVPKAQNDGIQYALSDEQIAATNANGPALCLGPAFSGKSVALVERCRGIIERPSNRPSRVLILCAYRRNVGELRSMLAQCMGTVDLDFAGVRVCTLDSLCYESLKRYGSKVGVPERWSISNDAGKNRNELTFDQVIGHSLVLFEHNSDILAELAGGFEHILIDGLERFGNERLAVIKLFAGLRSHGLMVNSRDESVVRKIYGDIHFDTVRLTRKFGNPAMLRLADDLRSGRRQPKLDAVSTDCVTVATAVDIHSEMAAVCELIRRKHAQGTSFGDQVVFCATRIDADRFRKFLKTKSLPSAGARWSDEDCVKDLICLLLSMTDRQQDVSAYERRLLRLFTSDENRHAELARLKRFDSATDAVLEFLAGRSGYLVGQTPAGFDRSNASDCAAIRQLLTELARCEENCRRTMITREMPGGECAGDVGLFESTVHALVEALDTLNGMVTGLSADDARTPDRVKVASPTDELFRRYSCVYMMNFASQLPTGLENRDREPGYERLAEVVEHTMDSATISFHTYGDCAQSHEIEKLVNLLGQSTRDVVHFQQVPAESYIPLRIEPLKPIQIKPCYRECDLTLYLECPRKYLYAKVRDVVSHESATTHKLRELQNCFIEVEDEPFIDARLAQPKPNASSRIINWFNSVFPPSVGSNSDLAPGQSLRWEMAAAGIAKADFAALPRSTESCRTCTFRWVCPE